MITEELIICPSCGYDKALTHWSSGGDLDWIACPKCLKFFDHGHEEPETDAHFWNLVRNDTGYYEEVENDKDIQV
jgi:hypothetical protein